MTIPPPPQPHTHSENDPPSLGELLSNVSEDLSVLVRQELALAKAEATQTARRVGTGSGMLVGAAVAGYFVLLFLSVALWAALGSAIGHGWSALIVVLVWAIIGAVLAVLGRSALRTAKGLPQTTDTVTKIPGALAPHPQEKP
ncbi:phage holin family protein [Williamsia sp. DF01-3]|uniref:phage holin family protein n=1 Tax=Williamsia sp. DF01-3 TaxID=2934157 RepID=UPI001FF54C5C|nr:phage holin family protein [Williamsia sp. DF01-3]MCK0517434.1 phage holin family protein [Williamsia sp. DF01-3]